MTHLESTANRKSVVRRAVVRFPLCKGRALGPKMQGRGGATTFLNRIGYHGSAPSLGATQKINLAPLRRGPFTANSLRQGPAQRPRA
jgi:hypothetical protein